MAGSKPTVVVVPGGWHSSNAYEGLASCFQKAGYPTAITKLPSLNPQDPSVCDCRSDAASVRQQLLPLLEDESKDVIILCHSYGGIPAGGAAYGLSKSVRKHQRKIGGVLGLIYLTSFVVPEDESLVNYLGGKHPPYLLADNPSPGLSVVGTAGATLYGDVSPKVAKEMEDALLPHAILAFESPAPPAAWAEPAYAGKLGFLRCTQDAALPTFVQDLFVQRSGVEWIVKDIEASHSAFLSKPEEVVMLVEELSRTFEDDKIV